MEMVYHEARFYLRSLIFAAISLIQIFLLEKKVAVPPRPTTILPCCLLAVLPELQLERALGAGGCRIFWQCLCSIHGQTQASQHPPAKGQCC